MMYISTDYVFDGTGEEPWKPTDKVKPVNTYGQSKLDGENIVKELQKYFIVRISWVFGINGGNFVKTMVRLSNERDKLTVVDDQYGSPTYTYDLAPRLVKLMESQKYGTYHAHNSGICTWNDFAKEIFHITGKNIVVNSVKSCDYKTKAKRPLNSRMDTTTFDNITGGMPDWKDATKRFLEEYLR